MLGHSVGHALGTLRTHKTHIKIVLGGFSCTKYSCCMMQAYLKKRDISRPCKAKRGVRHITAGLETPLMLMMIYVHNMYILGVCLNDLWPWKQPQNSPKTRTLTSYCLDKSHWPDRQHTSSTESHTPRDPSVGKKSKPVGARDRVRVVWEAHFCLKCVCVITHKCLR